MTMHALAALLMAPAGALNRRFKRNRASFLAEPPPPPDTIESWDYGAYSVKATVEACDEHGELDKTFIGYSQNMDITERTATACDRYKTHGTTCGEVQMVIKGGECDEVIFMKLKNNTTLIRLL
jgi:hypothetical protein